MLDPHSFLSFIYNCFQNYAALTCMCYVYLYFYLILRNASTTKRQKRRFLQVCSNKHTKERSKDGGY